MAILPETFKITTSLPLKEEFAILKRSLMIDFVESSMIEHRLNSETGRGKRLFIETGRGTGLDEMDEQRTLKRTQPATILSLLVSSCFDPGGLIS
jgi:hypothetical protein